jgi:hypothetical protein
MNMVAAEQRTFSNARIAVYFGKFDACTVVLRIQSRHHISSQMEYDLQQS